MGCHASAVDNCLGSRIDIALTIKWTFQTANMLRLTIVVRYCLKITSFSQIGLYTIKPLGMPMFLLQRGNASETTQIDYRENELLNFNTIFSLA